MERSLERMGTNSTEIRPPAENVTRVVPPASPPIARKSHDPILSSSHANAVFAPPIGTTAALLIEPSRWATPRATWQPYTPIATSDTHALSPFRISMTSEGARLNLCGSRHFVTSHAPLAAPGVPDVGIANVLRAAAATDVSKSYA